MRVVVQLMQHGTRIDQYLIPSLSGEKKTAGGATDGFAVPTAPLSEDLNLRRLNLCTACS